MTDELIAALNTERRRQRILIGVFAIFLFAVGATSQIERAMFAGGVAVPSAFAATATAPGNYGDSFSGNGGGDGRTRFVSVLPRSGARGGVPGSAVAPFVAGPATGDAPGAGIVPDVVGAAASGGPESLGSGVGGPGSSSGGPGIPGGSSGGGGGGGGGGGSIGPTPTVTNPPTNPPIVVPVPEPDFWILAIVGFGAIGWRMRRQKAAKQALQPIVS